jgi:hypothetical protein
MRKQQWSHLRQGCVPVSHLTRSAPHVFFYLCKLDLNLRNKLVKCHIGSTALCGAKTQTLRKIEMWCWRRMEKISWTDRVRNEEVLYTVKEERNIVHTIKRRKTDWNCHILRRNCPINHVIEGEIERSTEMTERRRRRCKQLLDDIKETRGNWKLKQKALALDEAMDQP